MGTTETRIDLENGITIRTSSGEISAAEIRSAICSYYEGEVTRLLLWDFTKADIKISAREVQDLAALTDALEIRRLGGRKTALVFSPTYAYGMGRMYDITKESENEFINNASFRDLKTALEWLGVATEDYTALPNAGEASISGEEGETKSSGAK